MIPTAPMIPIVAAMAAKEGGEKAGAAIKNDIAVVRWKTEKKKVGKGKHKRIKPAKDIELHVNPMSIGIGAGFTVLAVGGAALVGAVGLYAAGMHLERTDSKKAYRTMRVTVDHNGTPTHSVIQTDRGVPVRYYNGDQSANLANFVSDKEREKGWILESTTSNKDNVIVATLRNDSKKGYAVNQRSTFSLSSLAPKLF